MLTGSVSHPDNSNDQDCVQSLRVEQLSDEQRMLIQQSAALWERIFAWQEAAETPQRRVAVWPAAEDGVTDRETGDVLGEAFVIFPSDENGDHEDQAGNHRAERKEGR